MANKYSLHIGVTSVIPFAYGGWEGHLDGTKNDAVELMSRFYDMGYKARILIDGDVVTSKFIEQMEYLAEKAESKDTVFISFSGHGGQIEDLEGGESDGMNETIIFADRPLLDDELHNLFSKFRRGVRLIFVSDSCHSGTVYKGTDEKIAKNLPDWVARTLKGTKKPKKIKLKAGLLHIAGCEDSTVSYDGKVYDGRVHGFLSASILQYLDTQKVKKFKHLTKYVKDVMPSFQVPVIKNVKYRTSYRKNI